MKALITAVILAAGSGSRLRHETPKQFSKLAGRSILELTFEQFDRHEAIAEILIMVPTAMMPDQQILVEAIRARAKTPMRILEGGETRNQSTLNAVKAIANGDALILVHDAARPLVSAEIISRCVDALQEHDAIDVVIECADTIVKVDENTFIDQIPDRKWLRRGQTPQGFKASVLRAAYDRAEHAGDLNNTDDCGVVLKYCPDVKIKCVLGAEHNLKITHPIDLVTADRMFQLRTASHSPPFGDGQNQGSIASKVIVVFGSSSGIGKETLLLAREKGAEVRGFSLSEGGVDIRVEAQVGCALEEVFRSYGRIDAIVNSAGTLQRGALTEMSLSDVKKIVETNLLGAFVVARAAVPFLEKTRGHLVFFTSSSYTRGRSTYSAYSAAKAGLVNMAQALAEELADQDIKVNCINPERTATRMRSRAFPGEDQSKMLSAKEVAHATISLIQTNITGQVIDVRREANILAD